MYSPAAIEKAPAARPARPASSTALLSSEPPLTPAMRAKFDTRPSEAPKTAGRSQPPVTSECSCEMRSASRSARSWACRSAAGPSAPVVTADSSSSSTGLSAVGAGGSSEAGAWSRRRASSSSGVSRPGRFRALTTR